MIRILFTIVLLLFVIAIGGVVLILVLLRASLPKLDGEVRVAGLESPVKITSDRYGIPTIAAHSRLDATLAQGYITARDRLWQMDILRRRAAGRLSEILGKSALGYDKRQRTIGFAPRGESHRRQSTGRPKTDSPLLRFGHKCLYQSGKSPAF